MIGVGSLDEVFRALADASRRRLLDSLNAHNGQSLRELCAGLAMARQSVSKHLAVLEAADLVTTAWRGREKLHFLNAAPINALADRWIRQYDRDRAQALADLTSALEFSPVADDAFVYTTYINAPPEKVWQAITDPVFTQRYWGARFETDWKKGSLITWHQDGVILSDPGQVVLESDPYRRLAYTWHTVTEEFADHFGLGADFLRRANAENRSRVSFDIEPHGTRSKLTVVHDGFDRDSVILATVRNGWPAILSNLKTLLETGETMPQ